MRVVLTLACATAALGCAGDDGDSDEAGGRPEVVVTSTILGDIVGEVVGDAAAVEVLLPIGADPHDFALSTREAERMAAADLLVVNGAGFEAGLEDSIEAAAEAGTDVFAFTDHAELLDDDPHLWTDPVRLIEPVTALVDALADAGIETGVGDRAAAYIADLEAVDAEVEALLADLPPERRVLVTNHEVLAYFADRYEFEVIGAVIPSTTTGAEPSAADLEDLSGLIAAEGVPAIFAETSSPAALAEALADAVEGDVDVIELFTESLGDEGSGAETYLDLTRTNARLIHEGLAP